MHDSFEEGPFVWEMVIDGAFRHPRGGRDISDGARREPVFGKRVGGGVEDGGARLFGVFRATIL
ncbi:hypothetical protein [Mycobacterium palustre]|uniref:hypothetical protein n=1 Tax=Mycobacterium palustre TaxID=153971 RepID=UPI001FE2B256|nr:hypothetical protein [Mycobacterium palustre]